MGRYLAIRYDGEIRKRDTIKKLAYDKDRQGIHARHVMDSYELWLHGTPELDLLYIMGLFDHPAPLAAIEALKQEPVIKGLTDSLQQLSDEDWDFTIQHLRDLRLLSTSDKGKTDTRDCHPLIREHFAEKLKAKSEQAWKKAHGRLYDYYKDLPEKVLPDTLEEMEPLFAAVAHGCQAGRHEETGNDIFVGRIRRGNEVYDLYKLGATGADLAALSNFFEIPWSRPVSNLSRDKQAAVLSWAGYDLRALGRLREALQAMQAGMENSIEQRDWKGAAQNACNLSEIYLTSGDMPQAVGYARQNVDFANRSGDGFQKCISGSLYAYVLFILGKISKAKNLFRDSEIIQKEEFPYCPHLVSMQGFYYRELLLTQGLYKKAKEQAHEVSQYESRSILNIALNKLTRGSASLLQALSFHNFPFQEEKGEGFSLRNVIKGDVNDKENLTKAMDYLNQAVADLRKSGEQIWITKGLLERAISYRIQSKFPSAWDDLAEALEIAERGSMKLWLVDYHLEAGRIVNCQLKIDNRQLIENGREVTLSRDEMIARLKMHVEQAEKLVKGTGYRRRDAEVEMGYASLFFAQGDQAKAREHLGNAKQLLDRMGIRMWDFEVRRLEQVLG